MEPLHHDRARAGAFGTVAEAYDRARPSYPEALVDALAAPGVRDVLDVGCGTGIASRLFQDRGCDVLGVEHDARMAAIARQRGTAVEVAAFEEWEPAGRSFDLLISAQAWHWIEPERGAAMAADVLRAGAGIALFWNVGRVIDATREALDAVYARLAPELADTTVAMGGRDRMTPAAEGIAASGAFGEPERHAFGWERAYSTAEWVDNLRTHSDHALLAQDRREALLDAVGAAIERQGGSVTVRYETTLLRAAKKI